MLSPQMEDEQSEEGTESSEDEIVVKAGAAQRKMIQLANSIYETTPGLLGCKFKLFKILNRFK